MADPIDVYPNSLLTEPEFLRKLKRHVASLEKLAAEGGVTRPIISMEVSTAKRLIEMAERSTQGEPHDITSIAGHSEPRIDGAVVIEHQGRQPPGR